MRIYTCEEGILNSLHYTSVEIITNVRTYLCASSAMALVSMAFLLASPSSTSTNALVSAAAA